MSAKYHSGTITITGGQCAYGGTLLASCSNPPLCIKKGLNTTYAQAKHYCDNFGYSLLSDEIVERLVFFGNCTSQELEQFFFNIGIKEAPWITMSTYLWSNGVYYC